MDPGDEQRDDNIGAVSWWYRTDQDKIERECERGADEYAVRVMVAMTKAGWDTGRMMISSTMTQRYLKRREVHEIERGRGGEEQKVVVRRRRYGEDDIGPKWGRSMSVSI